MNTDQHPALIIDHDDLPGLTLVLPGDLGKDQTLTGLARAIGPVRTELAARARQFQQLEEDCAASGDPFHEALCRGQALGGEHAASAIDEAIIAVFSLWDQYQAQDPVREATAPRTLSSPASPLAGKRRRVVPHQSGEVADRNYVIAGS